VRCRQNWVEYDQNCYYTPQAFTDAGLNVIGAQTEAACQSIGGTSIWTPTELGAKFLLWQACSYGATGISYRSNAYTASGSQVACDCYTCNGTSAFVDSCSCENAAFNFCRYSYAKNPVPYWQTSMSPITRSILINGQKGTQHHGPS
jgi:hypothetical protein